MAIFLIFLSLFLSTFAEIPLKNLSNYPYPHPLSNESFERIAIFATNDIHGHLVPDLNAIPLSQNIYKTGGTTLLSSYIKSMKKEWKDNLVWLDAGDEYQGTMESNLFVGEPIVKFMNYMNLTNKTTAAVGNHDFDFGFKNMSKIFSQADFPYVSANIYNKTDQNYWNFTNFQPDNIIHVGNIKIGIIGLTTIFTPSTTATNVEGLDFEDYVNITINESKKLKLLGGDIILLTCHVGVFCQDGDVADALNLTMRRKQTAQKSFCVKTEELYVFLNKLPSNILNGVVGGHLHTIVHHWINDIPVVLGDCNARHFNVLYFTFDKTKRQVISNLTEIEGPVPVCETLIDETRSCYVNTSVVNLTSATYWNFTFHNEKIEEDLVLRNLMNPYLEAAEKFKRIVLAEVENPMRIEALTESALGDFISDAVQKGTGAEISLINRGMLRIDWPIGNLTYYKLYETIPFDDVVSTFEITGEELLHVMTVLQNGSMAFYPTSGLKQYFCKSHHRVLNLSLIYNDEPLNLTRTYIVGANNFLIRGGDDFTEVLKFYTPRNIKNYGSIRDTVAVYASELKILNSIQNPILDPLKPRIIMVDCPKNEEIFVLDKSHNFLEKKE